MASAVVKFALEKVGNILIQEGLLLYGVRDDIEWLRDELEWMECFLVDAERKEKKGDDERVKNWVMKLRVVVFEAEDVMDTFIIKQIQKRRKLLLLRRSPRIIRLLKRYALYPFELKALHNIATQIARIRTKVRGIKESREAYGIVDLGRETRAESSRTQPLRQLHPHLDDDTVVVGFGDHKKVIVDHLLDTNMESRCVISIFGMGGLGKTTLASKVYDEIKSNFEACAWITVSQEYNDKELLKSIIRKVNPAQNIDLVDDLVQNLKDFLREKKYLIVMDDIWDTDVWALVKYAFPNANNGSRVLFTTRFINVAKSADGRISPVEMPYLNDEQSRELLLRKALPTHPDVKPSCPDELEEVADELIGKCGGLPLALVVLGGLLSVKGPTFNAWNEMADSLNWDSTRDGKGCLDILALSYEDLPDHRLKSCFLYLGCWPEDSVIKASELVWQWIGEGFVASETETGRSMEETAMGYLDELAQRCMIQVVKRSWNKRRILKFRIHDLFRDLCISVAKRMRFFTTYNYNKDVVVEEDVVTSRRLVVCKAHGDDRVLNADTMRSSHFKARSLLLFVGVSSEEYEAFTGSCSNLLGVPNSSTLLLLQPFFHRFRLLRVIHLGIIQGDHWSRLNIPEEIGGLFHLRYLKVTCDDGYRLSLPPSIGNLSNLQTLVVDQCSNFIGPMKLGVFELVGRRRGFHKFIPSSGIGRLKMLQILKNVEAGRWMRQLKELSSLRKLGIECISKKEQVDMLCDSLCKLDHLTSLYLQFYDWIVLETETLFNSLPSHRNFRKLKLQGTGYGSTVPVFPNLSGLSQNLTNLSLESIKVAQETVTALEGLQGLVVLKIRLCTISDEDEVEIYFRGGFPRLQHLRIVQLEGLRYLTIESGAMKDLAQLTIHNCWSLEMMPEGLEHLASLKKLEVSGMPDDFVERTREDFHKIQHIPSIHIR